MVYSLTQTFRRQSANLCNIFSENIWIDGDYITDIAPSFFSQHILQCLKFTFYAFRLKMDTVRFNCPAGLVRGFMYSVYIYFFLFFFFSKQELCNSLSKYCYKSACFPGILAFRIRKWVYLHINFMQSQAISIFLGEKSGIFWYSTITTVGLGW